MKERRIMFKNKKTGEMRVVVMPEKPTTYFFRKWFSLVNKENMTTMERFGRSDGTFNYNVSIDVPKGFKEFRKQMVVL